MKMIDPMRVVSIPGYAARLFVGYRFVGYARGVSDQPGLADYAIFPINEATRLADIYARVFPIESIPKTFKEIRRGQYFVFFKRIAITEDEKGNREYFTGILKEDISTHIFKDIK